MDHLESMCKGDVIERRPGLPAHQGFQRSLRPLFLEEVHTRLQSWLIDPLHTSGTLLGLLNIGLDLSRWSRHGFDNVLQPPVVRSLNLRIWRWETGILINDMTSSEASNDKHRCFLLPLQDVNRRARLLLRLHIQCNKLLYNMSHENS